MKQKTWATRWIHALAVFGLLGAGYEGLDYQRRCRREDSFAIWWAVNALRYAEAQFGQGDLDGNGIQDYWTGDLAGLLAPFLAGTGSGLGPETAALANADAAPLFPRKRAPVPFHGFYVIAVVLDEDGEPLQVDTDGSGAHTHHPDRFAFCLYPAVYEAGTPRGDTWFITAFGRFKSDTGGKPVLRWPPPEEMRMKWARCC